MHATNEMERAEQTHINDWQSKMKSFWVKKGEKSNIENVGVSDVEHYQCDRYSFPYG